MTYWELKKLFRADLDDDVTITQAHNDRELFSYMGRGLRLVNNRTNLAIKEQYIILQQYIDRNDLPTDYKKVTKMVDVREQVELSAFRFGNELQKVTGRPIAYQIEESKKRAIYFDRIPDDAAVAYDISLAYTAGDSVLEIYSDDFSEYFQPTVIKFNSNDQYALISYVVDKDYLTGNGTITSVGTAVTCSANFGNVVKGDFIVATVAGTSELREVTVIDVGGDSAVVTIASAFSVDISVAVAYEVYREDYTAKQLYISDPSMDDVADANHVVNGDVYLVDIVHDYVFDPDPIYKTGTGLLTTVGVAVAINTAVTNIAVGDYLYYNNESRKVTEVTSTTVYVIESAFTADVTGVAYSILDGGDIPPLPIYLHESIIVAGKIFALENESRTQEALQQQSRTYELLDNISREEAQERADAYNNSNRLYSSPTQSWNVGLDGYPEGRLDEEY